MPDSIGLMVNIKTNWQMVEASKARVDFHPWTRTDSVRLVARQKQDEARKQKISAIIAEFRTKKH
jgi:hypothetical protein